jgi:uncharacterized protein
MQFSGLAKSELSQTKTLYIGFISLAIAGFCLPSKAITVKEVPDPKPNGWVTDTINIINPKTEAKINQLINKLEAKNSSEIIVITVPETAPYSSPREFALAWFKHWTIGKKELDNGVLLMYTQREDRIEIVTGWGIIEILPDDEVVSLIKRKIRPRVNQRDYNGAMLTGTQEIIKVVQTYKPRPSPHNSDSNTTEQSSNDFDGLLLICFFLVIFLNLSTTFRKTRSPKTSNPKTSNPKTSNPKTSSSGDGGGGCGGYGGGDSDSGDGDSGDGGGGDGGGGDGGGGDGG